MGADAPLLAISTVGSQEDADRIARTLVEERLTACVNVVPGLTSVYRWQGAVMADAELLLLMKTTPEHLVALEKRLLEIHPYEVPEFIAVDIARVADAYRDWLVDSVTPSG